MRIFFCEPHHLAHLHYDLGEGQSAVLVGRNFRSHGETERVCKCKQPFVVRCDEMVRQPGSNNG
jgi:hypothetical protein